MPINFFPPPQMSRNVLVSFQNHAIPTYEKHLFITSKSCRLYCQLSKQSRCSVTNIFLTVQVGPTWTDDLQTDYCLCIITVCPNCLKTMIAPYWCQDTNYSVSIGGNHCFLAIVVYRNWISIVKTVVI